MDATLRSILIKTAGFDLFSAPSGTPLPNFMERRTHLKVKHGGLGFRLLSDRFLLLNSLCNTMPLAIDRKDEKGNITKGLWNSLSGILGAGSFDVANKENCWSMFHASGHPFGLDHRALITRVQGRYRAAALDAGESLENVANLLTSPVASFAYGLTKVHKTAQDLIRQLNYTCLLADSKQLAGDDQRAVTFLATHDSPFANSFPATSDPSLLFSEREFQIALGRKMGAPLSFLRPYFGSRIKSNGNSCPSYVDLYGNGIASAPGVPGDHFRRLHDRMVCTLVEFVRSARVLVKGGHTGTCKDTFSKCLKVGDATDEEDQRLIQGIIPDMVIDARGRINGGTFPDNPLDDRVSLIEHKTLASMKVTVESRAHTVQRDLKKRAEDLDSRHPGSTFSQELASYGKYFVLISGPFANLSSDFNPLVDFIARERSLHTMEFRDFIPGVILSMQKRTLIRRIGLYLCRGWAQHIVDRWRDAVSPGSSPSASDDFDLLPCDISPDFLYRGAYRGNNVPGA